MTTVSNFQQLDELKRALAQLPSVAAHVADRSAPEITDLARAAFDAGRTPYGSSFGQGVTLNRSGRLRAGAVNYRATGTKISASVAAVPYARYQLKHGYLPARGAALPASWSAVIDRAAQAELAKVVGQ